MSKEAENLAINVRQQEDMNMNESNMNKNVSANHHSTMTGKVLILGITALLFAAAAYYFIYCGHQMVKPSADAVQPGSPPVNDEAAKKEKLRNMIRAAEARLNQERQRQLEQFKASLASATSGDYAAAKGNIESVITTLTGFGSCFKLSYKFAKDQVMKTKDADAAINEVINSRITGHCVNSNRQAETLLGQFQNQAVASSNQYRAEMMQILQTPEFSGKPDLRALSGQLNAMQQNGILVQNIAVSSSLASAGLGIDIVVAVVARETLKRVLSAVVSKLVTTAGTSAGCAIADGPLPIGDAVGAVIAVGGLGWSAYDLYQARKVLPDKLRASMNESIDNYYSKLSSQTVEQAVQVQNSLTGKDSEITQAMLNQI